jgi:DNA ligase (NAD+)
VTQDTIFDVLDEFSKKVKTNNLPSDGLVLTYDDISYGESLGKTAKFPRDSIAFKWKDELAETKLNYIEWSPSRTGLINPVAVFDTVELEGTSVRRASVHNLSVMENLKLGIDDHILVYKANMIIPQIAENLSKTNTIEIPKECPACGEETEIRMINEARVLFCNNQDCPAKKNKSFALFVSRNALNIDGLSESTLEKLIAKGLIHSFSDIFALKNHKEEISKMEGFGEKSATNLLDAIAHAKETTMARLLYGLGIANIGVSNAKVIVRKYKNDFEALKNASFEELVSLDGVGDVIAKAFVSYFAIEKNRIEFDKLCNILTFEEITTSNGPSKLEGKTMVITGSLFQYKDRTEMKEAIERLGGKVTGSVSSKTDYLINNDTDSTSSKNKKAKELGIPILNEDTFIKQFMR